MLVFTALLHILQREMRFILSLQLRPGEPPADWFCLLNCKRLIALTHGLATMAIAQHQNILYILKRTG